MKWVRFRQALDRALAEAAVVAREAVLYTKQVLVNDLKKASSDGKLTKEEAARAMETAWQYLRRHMAQDSLQVLEAAFGPVEAWAKERLESALGEAKALTNVPPSSSSVSRAP